MRRRRTSRNCLFSWLGRLPAAGASAALLGALAAGAAGAQSAPEIPVLSAYDMPVVELADGGLVSEVPMRYLGTEATARATPDAQGLLSGSVTVGPLTFPARVTLGLPISPGIFMARFILPGGEQVVVPSTPALFSAPTQLEVGAPRSNVEVAGVQFGPNGEATLAAVPAMESATTLADVPVTLGRTPEGTYAGSFIASGQVFQAAATPVSSGAVHVTFGGGGLSSAVEIRFGQDVDERAPTIVVRVPRLWTDAWASGMR